MDSPPVANATQIDGRVRGDDSSAMVCFRDSELFNFEKLTDSNLFALGQIWAVYDNRDGMPRDYARIKRLDAPNFKAHVTWLDHVATTKAEDKWTDEDLPVACGSFCLGEIEISLNKLAFAHIVRRTKSKRRNYKVYPSKGEVWALYKGWSMQWASDANNHRSYEYEVVQVLSDFSVSAGVTVVPLVRVEGFVSLFGEAKDEPVIVIASNELLRFSHRVPFYRTDGNEKVGVPRGFLELDTACLPTDLDAAFPCVTLDSCESPARNEGIYTCPVSEFHNFEECLSPEKFEPGQIWAMYCDADNFPKFYGWISRVELEPFNVYLTWLEACPQVEQEKLYLEQDIPVSCGKFKICKWKTKYETTATFSHLVYEEHDPRLEIDILPKVGEIWAIYDDWSPGWGPSGINDGAEYSIGEIVKCTRASTHFSFLTKVEGYIAVFKPDRRTEVMKIPAEEKLRFSHRIPYFRLTEEEGGKLRDLYELDPASVPEEYFCRRTSP